MEELHVVYNCYSILSCLHLLLKKISSALFWCRYRRENTATTESKLKLSVTGKLSP